MRARLLASAALVAALLGCTTFHPVETTPEAMIRLIEPADTVRIMTRDGEELRMRVWFVTDEHIAGRVEGEQEQTLHVRFDRIAQIEVERLDLKKTVLGTVLPAVIAAALACQAQDCRTSAALTTRY